MVIGAVVAVARTAITTVGKQIVKTVVKEGSKAAAKEVAKEAGKSIAKEGFEKIGKEGFEKVLGKAGGKIFENIGKIGFDKVIDALKKVMSGKADDVAKQVLKDIFKGVPIWREALKHLGDLLFPAGGKKAGALLSDQFAKVFGTSAFGKMDSGM